MGDKREDVDALADAERTLSGCATELSESVAGLEKTVTTDNPWGADGPGTIFGMAYTEVLNHAVDAYGSHVEQLFYAVDGLNQWGGTSADTEHGNESDARESGRDLPA